MNWYLAVWKKFADFSGRARRKEYWLFVLFNLLVTVVLMFADNALGLFSQDVGLGLLSGLYSLAVLIPSLSVAVRRLHDTGRSGWWILIGLVPCIGGLVLLVLLLLGGVPGDNAYGPNPRALPSA